MGSLAHTVLAHMRVAEKGSCGTEQAVIVQGLYDRNSGLVCRIVNGGRDHRKSIMHMHEIRPFALHQRTKLLMGLRVPNSVAEQDQAVGAGHLAVAGLV